jgi:small-conductance mechanosensitive channel/CRP-like cAMP-binding protein
MSLWQNVETTSGFGAGLVWLMALFFVISTLLAAFLPMHRTRIRAALILFLLSFIGLLITATLPNEPGNEPAAHQWWSIASVFLISAAVVTLADLLIFDVCLSPIGLRPPAILSDLMLAVAYVATALFTLSHHHVPVNGIITTSAVLTAVIGFSLQDTLANVMGGMSIQLERSISVGDWIRVNDNVGVVKEIRWRQTSIETRTWDTVVIPNSVLTKSSVVVLGHKTDSPRQHQQYVYFNVDYRYPPTEVIAAIDSAVASDPLPNVAANPAPRCLLLDFKDSFAHYAVLYWLTNLWEDEATDSLIRCRAVFALKRQGISMAIPAFRNFQTEEDQDRLQRIENENLERRMAALSMVDLFTPLTPDERRYLAQRLRECPFAADEVMTRQDDDSPCLYIITKGSAEVRLSVGGAAPARSLATLNAGQFFGEMGLMTGDRRSASVIAQTDVTCLRLDKEDFIDVLLRRPIIAEHISEILVTRRGELNAVRDHLTGEAVKERMKNAQGDLLQRIRKFFTLEK